MQMQQNSEELINQIISDGYKKPLPNNPNLRYGTVLSPNELRIYAVAKNTQLRDLEFANGNLNQETYERILSKLPELEEKIAVYNIPPVSYTLEEREPDLYNKMMEDQNSGAAQQRRIDAGIRGNLPADYTPFEYKEPVGFKRKQEIASYGIDPDNPYNFGSREVERDFYNRLAFTSRTPSKKQIQYILDSVGLKGDLKYLDGEDPSKGFRFKEEGSDTYQILKNPSINRDDIRKFAIQESPAIVGDIVGTLLTIPGKGSTSIPAALGTILKTGFGSSTGAIIGDAARLTYGAMEDKNDLTIEEIAKEAGLTGAYAFGGTTLVNSFMKFFPAFYRAISGSQVPTDVLERFRTIFAKQEADALNPSIIYGKTPESVEEINEQIKLFAKKFNIEYKSYNPTLAGANPFDEDAADLQYLFLKSANDPELKDMYNAVRQGNQSVIRNMLRVLGQEFENGKIPLGKEVDAGVQEAAEQRIREYISTGETMINQLIKETDEGIPTPTTTLFDNITREDGSQILPKTTIRAKQIKENYLKPFTDEFDALIDDPKYNSFFMGGGGTRNTIFDYNKVKNNASSLLFKRKESLKEIEETLGIAGKDKELLYRLAGRKPDGTAFASKDVVKFTIKELFDVQKALNILASNSKLPLSQKFARNLMDDIGTTIDKGFNDDVWLKLGNEKVKKKYTAADILNIRRYQKENNYGLDLTASYKNMSAAYQASRNEILGRLIETRPENLINIITNTSVKGAKNNTALDEFLTVLKSTGNDDVNYIRKEFINHIRRNVINPDDTPLQQNKALNTFLKQNSGTVKSLYGDDYGPLFSRTQLNKINRQLESLDSKVNILKNEFGVSVESNSPVYDIVNNVIRAAEDTRITGKLKQDIDLLLDVVGDDEILKNQINSVTKNIFLRDFLQLKQGADGAFTVNPQAMNRILNEGFGPEDLSKLNFDDVFGPLLGKDSEETIKIFRLINTMTQREMGGLGPSESLTAAILNQEAMKAFPGSKFIQRMIIPPLTQTGRRVTAIDMLVNKRSQAFIGQMVKDPKFGKQVIAAYEGRLTMQAFASFLAAYGGVNGVYFKDMADELTYYDSETKKLKIKQKTVLSEEQEELINNIMDGFNE